MRVLQQPKDHLAICHRLLHFPRCKSSLKTAFPCTPACKLPKAIIYHGELGRDSLDRSSISPADRFGRTRNRRRTTRRCYMVTGIVLLHIKLVYLLRAAQYKVLQELVR